MALILRQVSAFVGSWNLLDALVCPESLGPWF